MTNKFSLKDILRFVVPSTLGVLIFLTPMFVDGRPTIGMGIIFELLKGVTQDYLPGFVTVLLFMSCCCSTYFSLSKKKHRQRPTNQNRANIHHNYFMVDYKNIGQCFCRFSFLWCWARLDHKPVNRRHGVVSIGKYFSCVFFSCVFLVAISY